MIELGQLMHGNQFKGARNIYLIFIYLFICCFRIEETEIGWLQELDKLTGRLISDASASTWSWRHAPLVYSLLQLAICASWHAYDAK